LLKKVASLLKSRSTLSPQIAAEGEAKKRLISTSCLFQKSVGEHRSKKLLRIGVTPNAVIRAREAQGGLLTFWGRTSK
jgi:hypothetical protein